jgi:quercetin dioxygenase-like cupin family protein
VTNDRREFLVAGLMAMAAPTLTERMSATGGRSRAELAPSAKPLAQRDTPAVNLDGWQVTASEVSYPAGEMSGRHRHPGFVIGYVLEGQYRFAVNDNPPATLAAGQMFFESFDQPGEVHAVSGNASASQPCKILALVFTKKGDPTSIPG